MATILKVSDRVHQAKVEPTEKKKCRKWTCEDSDEELVISGISGMFPNSDNMRELGHNLFLAKEDLITDDDRRWKRTNTKITSRTGKINEIDKFDAEFFSITEKHADVIDPMSRILLEKTYEAIIDAGYNPKELKYTRTGVFVGNSGNVPMISAMLNKGLRSPHMIAGTMNSMLANRISFWLGVHGPSYSVDSACSSSNFALENAYKSIKNGDCDAAIVGGCNLCLQPTIMQLVSEMGVLSPDGRSKCFDEAANGYVKSEGVVSMFIQKKRNARRMYARLIHAKMNSDGLKKEGIYFPSAKSQMNLMADFYEECEVNPCDVEFVEAHGTGTKAGDLVELTAIQSIFLPGRKEPLKIGSVKSNIGHSEPASGLCSVAKVILSYELGKILPNINFTNPRTDVDGFKNGKLKVVTEPTQWNGGLAAINNFGFGGTNCHILLDSNHKVKKNPDGLLGCDQSYLVVASGRTEEAVDVILNDVEGRNLDVEFVGLLHKIHEEAIQFHHYRGYTLLRKDEAPLRSIKALSDENRPIWFVYSGLGSQWSIEGSWLMKIPTFRESVERCHGVLKSMDVDLIYNITSNDDTILQNVINSSTAVVALMIALTDVLSAINIKPHGYIGYSLGEIGCAYADGCITMEQALLTTYYRAVSLLETSLIDGSMADVEMDFNKLSQRIPSDIDVASRNGAESCTISGPTDAVNNFVHTLRHEGICARKIDSSNIAFHSRYIKNSGVKYQELLTNANVNMESKLRTGKWISSSRGESEWEGESATYFGLEFLVAIMVGRVHFEEALRYIPENAIVIEIGPEGLLQKTTQRSLKETCVHIPLTSRDRSDNAEHLLCDAIGRLFQAGANPHLSKLYPPINFPVSRGTPMISPLVKWDHKRQFYVYKYDNEEKVNVGERKVTVSLKDEEHKYLLGHVINGRCTYPVAGYLVLVWKTLSSLLGKSYENVSVVFREVQIMRTVFIEKEEAFGLAVAVRKDRTDFEVKQNGTSIVSGQIFIIDKVNNHPNYLPPLRDVGSSSEIVSLTQNDVYKELKSKGYHYKGLFRGVTYYNFEENVGRISWTNNFITFIDSMLQTKILMENASRPTVLPKSIGKIVINTKKHFDILDSGSFEVQELPVYGYKRMDIVKCGGVTIENIKLASINQEKHNRPVVVDKAVFTPYINPKFDNVVDLFKTVALIISENSVKYVLESIEFVEDTTKIDGSLFSKHLWDAFKKIPMYRLNATILPDGKGSFIADDELKKFTKEIKKWPRDKSCTLVIASQVLGRPELLDNCLTSMEQQGFLLAVESVEKIFSFDELHLNVCFECTLEEKRVLLLRRKAEINSDSSVIKMSSKSYSWLTEVQNALVQQKEIILFVERDPFVGICGFVKCLRKEARRSDIRCFFILDNNVIPFSPLHSFYKSQVSKNLALNIYKNGSWGTYTYLDIGGSERLLSAHAYVDAFRPGDLTSVQWIQGPLNPDTYKSSDNKVLIHVYAASLNFRDIMFASGEISANNGLAVGTEFAGKTSDGKRYMGIVNGKAVANVVECPADRLWPVPDSWTLEEAATVPVAYATVLYALFIRGRMKKGESVLIHSGDGDVGMAAINICLEYGCEIFTTVCSETKRQFIRKTFPSIPDSHIDDFGDESFEEMIKSETNGKGVDLVLNTRNEEKRPASVQCLAFKGRYLEIEEYDLSPNSVLGMNCFFGEVCIHSVNLNNIYLEKNNVEELNDLMNNGIKNGIVKPLVRSAFTTDQVESAFRTMVSGEYIGKVVIKIRNEELDLYLPPCTMNINALKRYFCSAKKSYIICGGLGGTGLELAEWLIGRGAHNIILSSRNGITSGYQARKTKLWRSRGINIVVSKHNIANAKEVEELLKTANTFGPVSAIFNVAVVLIDNIFEQQTEETFVRSAAAKVIGTLNLDELSRVLCPRLEHFVVFSSMVASIGNLEQTNYGFSNSALEQICEKRKADNFPALAIEWGAIGNVGILATLDTKLIIGGLLQQEIDSCLEKLDILLLQTNLVVRCFMVAEKEFAQKKKLFDMVADILGIKDAKNHNFNTTLDDLGLDSLSYLEIGNMLEKTCGIHLPPHEIRELTISKLHEMNNEDSSMT